MNRKKNLFQIFVLIIGLAAATVSLSQIASDKRFIVVAAVYLLLIFIIRKTSVSRQELGIEPENYRSGIKTVLPYAAVFIVGSILVFLLDSSLFTDDRFNQDLPSLVFKIFISIPFFTVILEEVAFRGVLLGLLKRELRIRYAVLISSAAFGLWHVFSAGGVEIDAISENNAFSNWILTLGVLIATTGAGVFFSWLRLKSNSLLAPIIMHWAINSTGVLLAYIAFQY